MRQKAWVATGQGELLPGNGEQAGDHEVEGGEGGQGEQPTAPVQQHGAGGGEGGADGRGGGGGKGGGVTLEALPKVL